ncbi:MAG: N-acetylmuramoyl-L-alanine amidase [Actinomycetota bacterium]|nr:N-acetylmuramoyl-L-alanine amidase [Actinomycetota bacterium]
MPPRSRQLNLLGRVVVLSLLVSVVVLCDPAVARTAPRTLADRRPVDAGPVEPGFPIDYLGVLWDGPAGHEHRGEDRRQEPHGAVRFRHQGTWGPWLALAQDGAAGPGGEDQWASGLVGGAGAEAYQVRGVPAEAAKPEAVAINTTDGPLVRVGVTKGGTAGAIESAKCRSRADWGADESLRLAAGGSEVWSPTHYPVQVATVHHTATRNDDLDPEATLRAIYRYHAIDNGWGDIGYHYLVDESGVVYEGRWSGTRSASCESEGGNGSDFAHEAGDLDGDAVVDEMTTAAHTVGANSGNLGVALLGDFTGTDPKVPAVTALEDLLAELSRRHSLNPTAKKLYINPVSNEQRTVDTISAHRDWTATECPGERLFTRLPSIRSNVAAKMASAGDSGPPADFDGDGDTDVSVFRPTNGYWFVNGGAITQFGTNGDVPVPGDYDGDGDTDIAVFRPTNGYWFVNSGAITQFGASGDIPVPGDYDSDGDTEVAVFRPATGVWFVRGVPAVSWGTSGDNPVPGDYDGDGDTDIAVFRPPTGAWFVRGGSTVSWGAPSDIPLALPDAIRRFSFPSP